MTPALPWFIVHAKPWCERKCVEWLRDRKGQSVYLPLLAVVRGYKERLVPLLPRYLFLRSNPGVDPIDLRYTPGVQDLVRKGDRTFARVAHEVIERLMRQEERGAIRIPVIAPFARHDRVVVDGAGQWSPTFLQMEGPDRARILITIFGSSYEDVVDLRRLSRPW